MEHLIRTAVRISRDIGPVTAVNLRSCDGLASCIICITAACDLWIEISRSTCDPSLMCAGRIERHKRSDHSLNRSSSVPWP